MATAKASITLRGRFPAGTKVGLHRRVDMGYDQTAVLTATTSKESETKFEGDELVPFSQWFAVAEVDGERRAVAVTAKPVGGLGDPGLAATRHATAEQIRQHADAQSQQAQQAADKDRLAASPALDGPDPTRQIVTGSRGSNVGDGPVTLAGPDGTDGTTFSSSTAGKPLEGETPLEAHPGPRQEDAGDTPQRSATLTGEATPVEKGEVQPEVPQRDTNDVPQRSDTEEGAAAIVEDGEVQPSLSQEDVPEGTQQRSDTPLGEAEPIPGAPPIKQKRTRDSSKEKAKGRTPAKPKPKTQKKAAGAAKKSSRGSSRSGRARSSSRAKSSGAEFERRSAAAKKAARTRARKSR